MNMTGAMTGAILFLGGTLTLPANAAEPPNPCPLHAQHQAQAQEHAGHADHFAGVDRRGDEVMGFSHERTVHHFLVEPEGGTIQVEATDPADAQSLQQIRTHLAEVARQLAAGNFSMPQEIHDRVLPGVPEMIERKDAISYRFEELPNGGHVVIRTADPEAVAAVHAFLEAQIGDHRTGDAH
jgi:hypothetical protein